MSTSTLGTRPSPEAPVQFDLQDGVATLTLNRPRVHNALNDAMRQELGDRFDEIRARDDVRVVLLRGEGRSFCSGRDTKGFVDPAPGSTHDALIASAQRVRLNQLGCGKPIICTLQGHVIGAGAELALGCDIRIAAADMQFSLPESAHGLVADTGSSTLLTAVAGPARAKWILLSGLAIGADQALQWNIVEWVVPRAQLDAFAQTRAAVLAGRPWEAVRRQKRLVDCLYDEQVKAGLAREMQAQLELFSIRDRNVGVKDAAG